MAYVKILDGAVAAYPYTLSRLISENPNTSFPKPIRDEALAHFGVFRVSQLERPTATPDQVVEPEAEPKQDEDGNWVIGWIVRDKTADELATELEERAFSVRANRDHLLKAVDIIAGNALRWGDLSPTEQAEVSAYRTALLDVPQQAGFPDAVTWPSKPSAINGIEVPPDAPRLRL